MAGKMDVDPPQPPPPRLVQYGPYVSTRLQSNLRECQKDALDALVDWFRSDVKHTDDSTAVVTMPTGSGKSGVICSLPYWFGNAIQNQQLDRNEFDLDKPILVIAPGLDILKQLESELIQSDEAPCFLVKVAAIQDERREVRNILYRVRVPNSVKDVHGLRYCQEDIVLTNAQKWRDKKPDGTTWRDLDSDLFSIIIVDEAHHLPAPQWKNIIDKFENHAKVIFFTATPYRTDGRLIADSITTRGFAYELTDQKAVENGTIRKIQFTDNLIKFNIGEPRVKYNPKNSEVHLRYINEVIDAVISRVHSKDKEFPLPDEAPHCAMLITASTIEAESVADMCRQKAPDLVVEHVHSTMKEKELKPIMKKIKRCEIRVLVIVKKLLEGFNYPRISVVGIVTRIRSSLVFAQFIGRARRVIRGESNIAADVITHDYFEQNDRL